MSCAFTLPSSAKNENRRSSQTVCGHLLTLSIRGKPGFAFEYVIGMNRNFGDEMSLQNRHGRSRQSEKAAIVAWQAGILDSRRFNTRLSILYGVARSQYHCQ